MSNHMKSENLDKLIPALVKAQGELQHAAKVSNNPHFKSKYADLATVLDTCKPVLQANGLAITHQRMSLEQGEHLVTTLWHTSGQYLQSISRLLPTKQDPQGYGSAMTYARRYDLSALIGLASDDDDGNAASQTPANDTVKKSVFGNAAMRKTYCDNTIQAIHRCETTKELNELIQINKPRFDEMRASGNEHDSLGVDGINQQYTLRLSALKEEENDNQAKQDMKARA